MLTHRSILAAWALCATCTGCSAAESSGEADEGPGRPRDAETDAARSDVITTGLDVAQFDAMDSSSTADVVRLDALPRPGEACHAQLRALGVMFTEPGAQRGVVDPVTVTFPINGVHFHYEGFATAERPTMMDCRLAVALHALSAQLRDDWHVTDVVHLGVYNYRCIAGSDPCRMSQHAYAMAIDLNAFRDTAGLTYTVTTDFVANGRPTCPPRATTAADVLLKDVACWMYDSRTFAIVLTPNYNADHRNHFHVDLTAGSHSIGAAPLGGVDPEVVPGVPDSYIDDF